MTAPDKPSNDDSDAFSDPRPIPPEKPLPMDCCETGCDICIFDQFADARRAYKRALAAWEARQAARAGQG